MTRTSSARAQGFMAAIACAGSITPPSRPSPMRHAALPAMKPPLMREHRLYQADWLMRFYGFRQGRDRGGQAGRDARPRHRPETRLGARQSRASFRSTSTGHRARCCCGCRGLAPRTVDRILQSRRHRTLRLEDVGRICPSIAKVRPFIVAEGWTPGGSLDSQTLRETSVATTGAARPLRRMKAASVPARYAVRLSGPVDVDGWRDAARRG